jgi:carbamate kinase
VVALGGNAILQPKQRGTFEEQCANLDVACGALAALVQEGHRLIITHGNGPQVGNILLQNEEAAGILPVMPLDACGAESQGLIGYMIQQSLQEHLQALGLPGRVVSILTRVEVDAADPAFTAPSKPIGPFYTPESAQRLMTERKYHCIEDAGRGWRRVVPSPQPKAVVERTAVATLLEDGFVVVAAGGGGIPVVRDDGGKLRGVEAVIDKDLAAERLARDVRADLLMILTDVERVCLNYRMPDQRMLDRVTVAEARRYQQEGHFRAGSMGPKVEAAVRFVEASGTRAVIGPLQGAARALRGETGTEIIP